MSTETEDYRLEIHDAVDRLFNVSVNAYRNLQESFEAQGDRIEKLEAEVAALKNHGHRHGNEFGPWAGRTSPPIELRKATRNAT